MTEMSGMSGGSANPIPQRTYVTGIILFMVPVVLFFLGLTSAMVVRRGLSDDWMALTLPPMLLITTAILLMSGGTMEISRYALRRGEKGAHQLWWGVTTGLGVLFLAGQYMVWQDLVRQGIYVSTNPSSSFFYVLTISHAVHVLGGLLALAGLAVRTPTKMTRATAVRVAALYWHFMGGLWIYVYLLLWLGR